MAVVLESALTQTQRETLKKARQADNTKNYDYAINLMQNILREQPAFLAGREFLRDIAIKKSQSGSKFSKSFGSLASAGSLMKAQSQVKKDPIGTLPLIEEILAGDPFHVGANNLLSQAAQAADLMEVACLAHQTLAKANTDDLKNLHHLGDLYLKMKDPRAKDVFTAILNKKPSDGDALTKLKDAEALGTIERGGWDKTGDYRDLIANKEEAAKLEQASKITKSDEGIGALIDEHYAKLQTEPNNPLHARRIAELYRQKEEFATAQQWYEHAWELGGRADAGVEKMVHDMELKGIDQAITQWEEYLEANPEAEGRETLEELKVKRAKLVLDEARARVAKYPSDLQFRFELGEALLTAGEVTAAIPELQAALRQPSVRTRAMLYLSRCFEAKGQLDIASRRLEEALTEIAGWDDTKRQITYQLAMIFEKMGNKDKYLGALKSIYEVDYGYRDVARRVEDQDNFPYKP